jgi:hypothetical protein
MKKLALSAVIASAVAAGAAVTPAQAGPGALHFNTSDGFKFTFGISQELIPEYVSNLDFDDTAIVNMSSGLGRSSDDLNNGHLAFESRVTFTAEKDRVSMYTMIEWDGILDERTIDHNDPNIERINLTLKLPEINGSFTIGADFFLVDSIGRMVYLDDDPGMFLRGSSGNMSWQVGWTKRNENSGRSGDSGGRKARLGDGTDHDTLSVKFLFKGKTGNGGSWMLEPWAIYQNRGGVFAGSNFEQNAAYLGLGGNVKAGVFDVSAAFAYHTGTVDGLQAPGAAAVAGGDEQDISAWAAHARAFLNLGNGSPFGGLQPFVSWDYASGDDQAGDGDLEAFVPITTPNDLRQDAGAFGRKSVFNVMPTVLGNGAAEFGFETNRIGAGPAIGGIGEAGLGESPGYHRFAIGLQGKVNPMWGLAARIVHARYDETANIGVNIDDDIGWGFDINVSYWPQKQLRITPFFSWFTPGDGAEQLIRAANAGADITDGYMGGIQFLGSFM